ncbi:hypothetical protein CCAX7_38360 [Capsulimonas corticalis]|uniref:Uncharacterized protein n=1 Tax=Capsulimonas corticalis TaxID=2219043 RepID=A0A402D6S4_9BACT|nr:hypothetical protein [Capsulimonas corticalis]BDI31785.1 hypothetical protein CCAX7_38360 [Capsulimonas corticalis]
MAETKGTPAGTSGMSAMDNLALANNSEDIGFVDPIIGRTAQRDVAGYFGFPLIRKGEIVTKATAEKALNLGRLFELIAATDII